MKLKVDQVSNEIEQRSQRMKVTMSGCVNLAAKCSYIIDFIVSALVIIVIAAPAIVSLTQSLNVAIALINMGTKGGFHGAKAGVVVDEVGIRPLGVIYSD